MPVIVKELGRVRRIEFNRPDQLNAFNHEQLSETREALILAENDQDVAVVVLTGCGKAFSAGADLQDMNQKTIGTVERPEFPQFLATLARFKKPLIAAVNGVGVGIGMTLLAYCDLVLISETARLRTPFPQLGLAPEAGSSGLFPAQVGWQNAAYVLLSGDWISSEEAVSLGFAWRAITSEKLIDETMKVARKIAANPISSLVETKALMLESGKFETGRRAHSREVEAYTRLMGAPANREAIAAFFDKRAPNFSKIDGC
jgi:enoyl-CoA hydratase/carnithine racemase